MCSAKGSSKLYLPVQVHLAIIRGEKPRPLQRTGVTTGQALKFIGELMLTHKLKQPDLKDDYLNNELVSVIQDLIQKLELKHLEYVGNLEWEYQIFR